VHQALCALRQDARTTARIRSLPPSEPAQERTLNVCDEIQSAVSHHRRAKPIRRLAVAAAAVGALTLAACGSGDDTTSSTASGSTGAAAATSTAAATPAKDVKIAALLAGSTAYPQASGKGIEAAASAAGASVQTFDAQFDPQRQLQQCQDAIASGGVQGIVVYPIDGGALVPCAEDAVKNGIQIVAIETPIGADFTSTDIQVEGVAGQVLMPVTRDAEASAQLIREACKGIDPCEVALMVGDPAYVYSSEKRKREKDLVAQDANIQIVAEVVAGLGDPNKGHDVTRDVLQAHPDVNVIVGDADDTMMGAQQAVSEAGIGGKVKLIGAGGSKQAAEGIASGSWFATIPYLPETTGRVGTELLLQAIAEEPIEDTTIDVTDESPVGDRVTSENVELFKPEW
jgi:ribose transport system substrate-binding protein